MALSIWKTARSVRLALAATAMGTYILGLGYVHANGFDACERPSCASKDDILRMMKAAESRAASRASQSSTSQTQASTTASGEIAPVSAGEQSLKDCDCPPDRAELGFHSWQLVRGFALPQDISSLHVIRLCTASLCGCKLPRAAQSRRKAGLHQLVCCPRGPVSMQALRCTFETLFGEQPPTVRQT